MFAAIIVAYVVIQYFTVVQNSHGGDDDGSQKAKSTGTFPSIIIGIVFSLATHNSIYTFLFGISFEHLLFWHKFLAVIGLSATIVHSVYGILQKELYWSGIPFTSAIGVLLVTGFFPYFRTYFYSVFLYIHWISFITVLVFSVLHSAPATIIIGLAFWGIDVLSMLIVACIYRKYTKNVKVKQLPGNVVRFKFLKNNFNFKAGQYVFLCVPKVSYFGWHPFSISSSPHEKHVTIHARALGNWTKQLYKKVNSKKDQEWSIYMHGPYGNVTLDIEGPKYKVFLLFTGGIGITPMQSIANELFYQSTQGRQIIKIIFVWSVREIEMVNDVLKFDEEYIKKALKNGLPVSFQPNGLIKDENNTGVFDVYCHLTKHDTSNSGILGNVHHHKHQYLKYGRPNLKEYFDMARKEAAINKLSEVAVMVCSPVKMGDDCRKMAHKESGKDVIFDFYNELFEL